MRRKQASNLRQHGCRHSDDDLVAAVVGFRAMAALDSVP
jgi:hypothetical protein